MGITIVTSSQEQETSNPAPAEANEESNQESLAQEEEQGDESEVTETTDEAEGDAGKKTDVDESKPKKKSGVQRLKEKISAKDQEIEFWKRQALESAGGKKTDHPKVDKPDVSSEKPKADNFETYDAYLEAMADWKVEQKEKASEQKRRESEVKTQHQRQESAFIERVNSFIEKHDDWDDVMEEIDDIPIPLALQAEFRTSENGPELMYELAKNRAELERIAKLPADHIPRALGRFEASLEKKAGATEAKTTKAPAPLSPVKAGSAAGVKKSITDPGLSFSEYERLRRGK